MSGTVFNVFLQSKTKLPLAISLKQKLLSARRFVFTPEAASKVGKIICDNPQLLISSHLKARPLFDNMWIEFSYSGFIKHLKDDNEFAEKSDHVAFYFLNNNIYTFVRVESIKKLTLDPVIYHLSEPFTLSQEHDFYNLFSIKFPTINDFYFGHYTESLPQDVLTSIAKKYGCTVIEEALCNFSFKNKLEILTYLRGTFRTALYFLLILHQPKIINLVETPTTKKFSGGKLKTFHSYQTISIEIDPAPILQRVYSNNKTNTQKRLHDVRGHWCYDKVAKQQINCPHDWVPVTKDFKTIDPETNTRLRCQICGGKNWWRADHSRGTNEKGRIVSNYKAK